MYCLSLHDNHFENLKKINYIPVGLGSENFRKNWTRDNSGNNISHKNQFYAEYTFHYWFWKNLLEDISDKNWIGFCAYRRYWANNDYLNHNQLNKIITNQNFKKYVLRKINKSWSDYETLLVEKIPLKKIKIMKIIKNGGFKSIIKNFKNFISKEHSIKFHFDVFHGVGKLDKALKVLNKKDKENFENFLINNNSFNRENMIICRSKKILKDYYKSVFKWLYDCESIFGFSLKKNYDIRIYAFLAERYLSYWFNKYSTCREWPFFFFDSYKNKLKL